MMQVLYSGLGGHGSVAFSLIRGDHDDQMDHSLLFFGNEELRPEYVEQCAQLQVEYRSVTKRTGLDVASWAEVFRVLWAERPDILVLHIMTLVPVALAYERALSSSVVYVDHQPNAVKTPSEWLSTTIALVFGKRFVLLTDAVVDDLRSRLGPLFREDKVTVINNGIDLDRFSPGNGKKCDREITISMLARFSDTKDQATLVKAFGKLVAVRPDISLRLVLAGDGSTWQGVHDLVTALCLADKVDMPGMLAEDALIECLRATDIYVQSSLGETMSTAVMQAMSVGLPVIGTGISGIINLMELGETGAVFPPEDVGRLLELLLDLVDEPGRGRKMGARAREVAEERFSHVLMFQRYAALCA